MEKVRIGVIGVGTIGAVHATALASSALSELIGIADVNDELREKTAQELGIKGYADYRELISLPGLDAVSICTPDDYHLQPVLDCMDARLHIILEKPLATRLSEAETIASRVREYDKKFMMAYIVRFDPRYALAKEAVKNGEIGDIVHMSALRNTSPLSPRYLKGRVSVLFFIGVHDLDQLIWMAESELERLYAESRAMAVKKEVGVDDTVLSLLKFKNGIIAQMNHTWACPVTREARLQSRLDIVGTKGQINIEVWNQGLKIHGPHGIRFQDVSYGPTIYGQRIGNMRTQLEHFLNCIIRDETPLVGIEEGLTGVRAVTALEKSMETGSPVYL
ncbi:MAG: Gfo/Idh/MocA family oxidoreductase [Deltaproteobacteria bacterium]|nr:Gfo/Idh/MocA family oxidoreductase [Deltaproteobacteria bacterium]MBW1961613.1 Gfo/Idh/MocA family oxidoreductase [Deltaproteobacteria bacterium]MBW1994850.1 Gfo/Idh/MocA family oxidoreductase [Deltaproteobacteria bacterium]MBW2150781.1 Gfo/Idh/MocA family oxidoreductase [Deltaproteobacteria bacterium]